MTHDQTGKANSASGESKVSQGRQPKSLEVREAELGLWKVIFDVDGGVVPNAVSGRFTSRIEAQKAIDRFYSQKAAKVLQNTRGYRRAKSSSNKASS